MKDLKGKNILITGGPTRADIDAVRFISNRSSGRLGARIAEEALARGAFVTLLAGPDSARPRLSERDGPPAERLRIVDIETVEDLLRVLRAELAGAGYDAVVHAMAVLDYQPVRTESAKVGSGRENWRLQLKRTPKVIDSLKQWSPESLLIGFKLESGCSEEELKDAAVVLLRRCRADYVVANDLELISGESHPALLIDRSGHVLARPQTKREIACVLCGEIARCERGGKTGYPPAPPAGA